MLWVNSMYYMVVRNLIVVWKRAILTKPKTQLIINGHLLVMGMANTPEAALKKLEPMYDSY